MPFICPSTGKKNGILLSVPVWCFFLLFCGACSSDNREKDKIEVTLAHDKGNLKVFQDHFIKQGERAEQAVGVGIRPVPSDNPELYRHRMKAALPTAQAPDLFAWWAQFRARELVDQDLVGDLTHLWDKYQSDYSKGMRDAFTIGGRVYGFPYVVEYWPVWYNKRLFSRLNLDPPDTWHKFLAVCETLKQAGITPVLSSLQDNWPAFIWFEEMIIGQDPDLYRDLCLGRARYADPRVKAAFSVWYQMMENGYFTDPSANMLTNAGFLWQNERFAMVVCGTWYYSVLTTQGVDKADIGAFILPSHNTGAGDNIVFEVGPIFTARNGPRPVAALKVADWWMSREGSGYFAAMHNAYPGNRHTDIAYLPPVKKDLLAVIRNPKVRVLNRYWEATPPAICEKAVEKFAQFILNPHKMDQVIEDIDRIARDYWEKHPSF